MASKSLYQRLSRVETDFLKAVADGPAALECFHDAWATLAGDVENAVQQSSIDDTTLALSHEVAAVLSILSESFYNCAAYADTIQDQLVDDLDNMMSKLTISDTPLHGTSSPQPGTLTLKSSSALDIHSRNPHHSGPPVPPATRTSYDESGNGTSPPTLVRKAKRAADDSIEVNESACRQTKRSRMDVTPPPQPRSSTLEASVSSTGKSKAPSKTYRFIDCSAPISAARKRRDADQGDTLLSKRPRVEVDKRREETGKMPSSKPTPNQQHIITGEGRFDKLVPAALVGLNASGPVNIEIGIPQDNSTALAFAHWAEIGLNHDVQVLSNALAHPSDDVDITTIDPTLLDSSCSESVNALPRPDSIGFVESPAIALGSSMLSTPSLSDSTTLFTPRLPNASFIASLRASASMSPEPGLPALCRSPESVASYDSLSVLSSPRSHVLEARVPTPSKDGDIVPPDKWDLTRDALYDRYRERGYIALPMLLHDNSLVDNQPLSLMEGVSSILERHC